MIDNLKRLSVFACASKLIGRPMRGYDGQCESDPTRLKKGVRANYSLEWHEAWFRVLNSKGLLDAFREKCSKINGEFCLYGNVQDSIRNTVAQAQLHRTNAQQAPHLHDHYMRFVRQAERLLEVYRMMLPLVPEVEVMVKQGLPLKRNKLVDWKDIDSVQFYKYDAETNSFVEYNHKVK